MAPPNLQNGDTIGVICPAGYMPAENMQTCLEVLAAWGFKVKTGKTAGNQFHYFSGTDEERLADLQQMLDDDEVKAVLCARGGYGLSRIMDQLNLRKFKKHPKWIIGFSDVTLLLSFIYKKTGAYSLHAPMAAAFNNGEHENEFVLSLKQALKGKKGNYSCEPHPFNRPGIAEAPLVGGNLALLVHQLATPSDVNTAGSILFVEDIGEYIYNIDRMLYQLKRAGRLSKLTGLVVGSFADTKDTTIPFGQTVEEVIRNVVKEYDYPIAFHFPVGHQRENYALKIGATYQLKVSATQVRLREV